MRKLIGILLIFSLTKEVIAHPPSLPPGPWPVVIFGKVNVPKENSSIKLAVNRIGFHQEELTTHLDAEGHFSFTFTTYVPTDAWIDYRTNFLILLHPGDSLYVEFDGTTNDRVAVLKSAIFKGDASATNESAALFQRLYYDSPFYNYDYSKRQNKIKDSTPSEYMRFCDSLREMAINFQKAYVKKVKPGNEVSNWSRLFIEDDYYLNASIYPNSHRSALVLKKTDCDVPGDYYNFLSQYYDIEQCLISGNAIGSYVSKYTYKYIRGKAQRDIAVLNRSMSIEQQDSILIQRIVEHSKGPIIREISLCFFLNDLLEESAIGRFEKNQAIANANITQPFLREPLFEKYFRKKKEAISNVQPVAEQLRSGISFVDSLIQSNKGKVIYIDVWATWCAPCREEFPYANRLEDAFGKNVLFLYLCLDSDKNAFQNLVKTFAHKGIHRFLDVKQSQLLKQKYNINAFPHYMLIDKNGDIANTGYEIRPSEDGTATVIRNLTQM